MNTLKSLFILLTLTNQVALANCNLNEFRWDCDMPARAKPKSYAHSLLYCGKALGYITQSQYDTFLRYQRADINMNLDMRGEYFSGACVPVAR